MPKKEGFTPGPIPAEALAYMRSKTLAVGFDHRDVWREAHATAFTVAKAMQVDVLESIQDALDQAMAEGRTFQQFTKELTPTLQRLGWWGESEEVDPLAGKVRAVQLGSPRRLKVIYDTNMTIAYQAGQWARIQRNKASAPYLKYVLGPSKEHRADHAQWAGTILPVDHEWWKTHRPKNGWGCQCDVIALSEFQAQQQGGVTQAPEVKTRRWVNKRTGEVSDVPVGIDPGWDFNPGAVALDVHTANVFGTKLKTARPDIGAMAMQAAGDYVRATMHRDFRRWAESFYTHASHHAGEVKLVSVMGSDVLAALRKQGIDLETAAITARDAEIRHLARDTKQGLGRALPESEVLNLPASLDAPKAVLLDIEDNALVYVITLADGRLAKVIIRAEWKNKARLHGKREKINTNGVVTATIVEKSNMPESRFKPLIGTL